MLNGGSSLSINHSGAIGSISWQSVPALLDAPAPLLARQWKKIFDQGKVAAPPMAVLSSAIFGYLAYRGKFAHVLDEDEKLTIPEPTASSGFKLYTVAAILVPSIIPYTVFLMSGINNKLQEKARSLANASLTDTAVESGVAQGETAHELLDKWATLNLGRSLLPLLGTLVAGWAIVDKFGVLGLGAVLKTGANRMG